MKYINHDSSCLLVGGDTVLSTQYSKKIDFVNYQYLGTVYDIIADIGMVNLFHHNSEIDHYHLRL